jgi:hypothetical protein
MALSLRDRVRAGMGAMPEWLGDREVDIARAKAEIEANARRFYGDASRSVRQALAQATPTQRGISISGGRPSPKATAQQDAPRRATSTTVPSSQPPARRGGSTLSREDQFLENARRLVGQAHENAQSVVRQAARSEPVRKAAGGAGLIAGNATGLVTGGLQLAKDATDGAVFVARLFDPYDSMRHPLGDGAANQVLHAAGNVAKQGKAMIEDPGGAKRRVVGAIHQAQRDLDPRATPTSPTLAGEVRRNFTVGKNQGELVVEGASWLLGSAELKAAAKIRGLSRADLVTKYLSQGFSPEDAAYLAELYQGMGHHSAIPRRATLPKWMGGGPVPKSVLDGPFNVLAPPGISRGEMYELHYKVDRDFKGARLRKGGRWVGSKLGLERDDPLQRIWHGTPTATKRGLAGAGMVGPVPFSEEDVEK